MRQHPVPSLPLLGRAGPQHVPLKMMHGFVMHQRENIKEFSSCTELCGDCIRLVWKVHNTSHMLQEHNSVCSISLCHCAPFLTGGPWLSILQAGYSQHLRGGKGKAQAPAVQPSANKAKALYPQTTWIAMACKAVRELCLHVMCNSSAPHLMCRVLNSAIPPLPVWI